MNLMIVAVAFASFSAVQADSNLTSSGISEMVTPATRAEAPQTPTATAADVNQEGAERSVCRRIVTSGSHRARRVCMTAEQWRQQDR